MRKSKKSINISGIKDLKRIMDAIDPRPMKVWWPKYKKEEKELEERKMNLIFKSGK